MDFQPYVCACAWAGVEHGNTLLLYIRFSWVPSSFGEIHLTALSGGLYYARVTDAFRPLGMR